MARRRLIAVLGDGGIGPTDPRYDLARQIGMGLVDAGYCVLCGGRGGVMEAVAMGGRQSTERTGTDVIGLLPGTDPGDANHYVDVVLPTGMGELRNGLIARADAVIAVGGGAGTLSELSLAWVYGRVCIAMRCEGWSGRLADAPLDGKDRFDGAPDEVWGADTADEAIALLQTKLGGPTR